MRKTAGAENEYMTTTLHLFQVSMCISLFNTFLILTLLLSYGLNAHYRLKLIFQFSFIQNKSSLHALGPLCNENQSTVKGDYQTCFEWTFSISSPIQRNPEIQKFQTR